MDASENLMSAELDLLERAQHRNRLLGAHIVGLDPLGGPHHWIESPVRATQKDWIYGAKGVTIG
jgi:hypothetical protein